MSCLTQAPDGAEIPPTLIAAPAPITDQRYSTLLATVFAYAMLGHGEKRLAWMTEAKRLTTGASHEI